MGGRLNRFQRECDGRLRLNDDVSSVMRFRIWRSVELVKGACVLHGRLCGTQWRKMSDTCLYFIG